MTDSLTDEKVLKVFRSDSGNIVSKRCSWNYLSNHGLDDIAEYLKGRFNDLSGSEKVIEILYRIENNIENRPVCPVCGTALPYRNAHGYLVFCSDVCKNSDMGIDIKMNKISNTCKKRFGSAFALMNDSVRKKRELTCIKKYGKSYARQTLDCIEKHRRTCIQKYGVDWATKTDKIKNRISDTVKIKYGKNWISQADQVRQKISKILQEPDIQHKRIESCRKNGALGNHKTMIEKAVEKLLIDRFGSDDVKYQYFDKDRYPFHCDFYVRSLDLFIEVNGFWMHGDMPYISENPVCESLVTDWRKKDLISPRTAVGKKSCYKIAIDTYTRRDPLKRSYAEKNSLRYLELFGTDIPKINRTLNEFVRRYEHRDGSPTD